VHYTSRYAVFTIRTKFLSPHSHKFLVTGRLTKKRGSVARSLSMKQLEQLAAYGARARLAELRAEIAAITRAFPDVADSDGANVVGRRPRRRRRAAVAVVTDGKRRRRRRGKLSAAGRAAISAAQKKRWAAIRRRKAASES
jgi:hypothetical protein